MKVVIAIDSFKGSMSSIELGNCIEEGIKEIYHKAEIMKFPIADGGEGTVEALVRGNNGKIINCIVNGPLMNKVEAFYGILEDQKTAIIEVAAASGLPLVPTNKRNPLLTTSYGTGELIKDALRRGCRKFIIGLGGSSTNDGGMGILQALGYKFYDNFGRELGIGGKYIDQIFDFDASSVLDGLNESKFILASDVDNVFYGLNGAAHVYAHQKGATEDIILELDRKLVGFSNFIKRKLGKDISQLKGSGAAGGIGGGMMAFLNSSIKPGIGTILKFINIEEEIRKADFVITGEGRIDLQSTMGKAPTGIAKIAKKYKIPCIAIAGCIADDAEEVHKSGISSMFSIINFPLTIEDAMKPERTKIFVKKNIKEIFRLIKVCDLNK